MDGLQILSTWLHTVAFVIAWGYYGVLGRMIMPALERTLEPGPRAGALLAIERRALPLVLLSVLLFTLTGGYLLVTDPQYAGLGNFLGSSWATLLLVKHLLVIVLVALGVAVDLLIRWAADATDYRPRKAYLRWLRWCTEAATAMGALVVLVTVAAQAA